MNDFSQFDPEDYLQNCFQYPGRSDFVLKCLAKFFSSTPSSAMPNNLKVLDYGCGPSIGCSISTASKAREIILADFAANNREYLQKWLAGDPSLCAFWTPYFEHVVCVLEGGSKEEVKRREDALRGAVKAVIQCDALKEECIQSPYGGQGVYDVVISVLCLETCCKDLEGYRRGVAKLVTMVKSGGYFVLISTRREHSEEGYYVVNGVRFTDVALKKDFVKDALQQSGLCVEEEEELALPDDDTSDLEGLLFFVARKI